MDASAEPAPIPFDTAALQSLEAILSAPQGIDIGEFLATLDEHFARQRSLIDVQAYREGRKPWKKLADEVVPVAAFLRHVGITGQVRFPLNDQPPDAWVREASSEAEVGIEVTRVLARSKVETARSLQDKPVVPGFLGLSDKASPEAYKQAKKRGRILNSRRGIERAIEGSITERLAGKSAPKFQGQKLLLVTPLGSAPDHDWEPLCERLQPVAKGTAFDQIFLVGEASSSPPVLLFDRTAQDVVPASAEP
ncbi:hypothetical protein [Caulobacter sp. 17J65-9]|uniref:hypothetical protein n=1 Tax=Caulobacter sp. 17J65-9 TaxID=2709382 RepID=UPI0013C9FFE1|nr:hypothetical protein [Caulobacter sp. 17J65-9]NEX91189.1 hypothetical protein [Caulobacter sp. 17J65-9]